MRVDALARFLAARPMPAAVVADVSSEAGLAAIRSLAGAGLAVVALDHRGDAAGFRSRFAYPALCPDPERETEPFSAFLDALAAALARPSPLFTLSAAYADAFAAARADVRGRFLHAIPAADDEAFAYPLAYWRALGARPPLALVRDAWRGPRLDPGPAIGRALRRHGGAHC